MYAVTYLLVFPGSVCMHYAVTYSLVYPDSNLLIPKSVDVVIVFSYVDIILNRHDSISSTNQKPVYDRLTTILLSCKH